MREILLMKPSTEPGGLSGETTVIEINIKGTVDLRSKMFLVKHISNFCTPEKVVDNNLTSGSLCKNLLVYV